MYEGANGVEQNIYIKHIVEMLNDVFGLSNTEIAGNLNISSSQLSNAIAGKRKINGVGVEEMLMRDDFILPTDKKDRDNRPLTTSRIISYLKRKGLSNKDIEQSSSDGYSAVVGAIMSRYHSGGVPPITYEGLVAEGVSFYKNGKYKDSIARYSEAEKLLLGDSKKEMALYGHMADAFLRVGDYNRSIGHYRQALDWCLFFNGEDDFKTASLYECLGFVLRKNNRRKEAKQYFEKAEAILQKKLSRNPDDHEVAKLFNNIGLMYLNEKEFENAEDYYQRAYDIRENNYKRYGNENNGFYLLEFAFSVHNMGALYNKRVTDRNIIDGEKCREYLNTAVIFHKKAYEMRMGILNGEDVISVAKKDEGDPLVDVCLGIAQSATFWASDLTWLGDYDEALKKCTLGLKIREAKYGKDSEIQDIAWSFYTMGLIYDKLGKYEEALKCFKESHRIRFKVCNGDHPYAAKALYEMGRMKYTLLQSDAILDFRKAYDIQKEMLKADDPELLDTIAWIEKIENEK